ncbi:glucan biosynthesis protein [Algihabitans sp.]|uniref:glucan biosynthesis protein n=1 Tax=Algihabitans sp. TaxID=2821514 RepID=UPI003BAB5D0A
MTDNSFQFSPDLDRRQLVSGVAAVGALAALSLPTPVFAGGNASIPLLEPRQYNLEGLIAQARALAQRPWMPPRRIAPEVLERVDYDAFQQIRFREAAAVSAGPGGAWPLAPFHLHRFADLPVAIHLVTDEGARQLGYAPQAFEYRGDLQAEDFPADMGYAGFRLLNTDGSPGDWLALMGASYFRSSDPMNQYGLSARGLAIDTTAPGRAEEFPRFTSFWLDQRDPERLILDALLDSPSLSGAYRMEIVRAQSTEMTVTSRLFFREGVTQLGVAPLTSMYWYSETNRQSASDWRPEVHDSDGLVLWTGTGERIWRPLNNPPQVTTSSFLDENPRGFGLMQRDRAFANYQDDAVFYERRPAVWIEPLGDWGRGSVQLIEIPTDDEIHDNIVCFWTPERETSAGDEMAWDYRLVWTADPMAPDGLGRTVATRVGRAGVPGQPRPEDGNKVAIDFVGGRLADFGSTDPVETMVSTSAGRIDGTYALRVVGTDTWRLIFDVYPEEAELLELRAFLAYEGAPLTETWAMQHRPVAF